MNERFKLIRIRKGLSQEEFGKRIGIESRAHISALENGNRNITDRIIRDICREFNVSESWLRTGEGEMFIQMDIDDEIAHLIASLRNEGDDSFKKRLLAVLANLTEEQWELLADLAQKLADK